MTGSVVYSAHDLVFFCNRKVQHCTTHVVFFTTDGNLQVAHVLLNDILEKLVSRAGNESR